MALQIIPNLAEYPVSPEGHVLAHEVLLVGLKQRVGVIGNQEATVDGHHARALVGLDLVEE